MRSTSVLKFDKENRQKDYKYIAKDMDGKLRIGWIVVEQPWYSPRTSWTYWMYSNKYGDNGMCGGCTDLGLERVKVNPETIKPFNQIEEIKFDFDHGFRVELIDKEDNIVASINHVDEIPYELWT